MLMIRSSFEQAMGVLLLVLTVILSLIMIHSPGTSDVPTFFLNWMEVVYQNGLIDGYSKVISGLHADYPPLSYLILYMAHAFGDTVGLSPLMSFKLTILMFQLISASIVLLLSGNYWIAAAFNGCILLGSVGLGYMDVFVAPPLFATFWALQTGRKLLATGSFLIACLTKWQPLIVTPFIAMYLLEISDFRSFRSSLGTPLFRQICVLVIVATAILSLLFGLDPARSLWHAMNHPFLSGNALNLPWLEGSFYHLFFRPSYSIQYEFTYLAVSSIYLAPNKIVFWVLFITICVRGLYGQKGLSHCLLFSITGFVTYVTWNSGVHENHLFVPVILAFMLMLYEYTLEHRAITIILSVMFNVNLFVFYGITGTELQSRVVGIDLSIILAMVYVIAWLLLVVHAWGAAGSGTQTEHAESKTDSARGLLAWCQHRPREGGRARADG
jgi:hypothetical protein